MPNQFHTYVLLAAGLNSIGSLMEECSILDIAPASPNKLTTYSATLLSIPAISTQGSDL